MSNIEKDELDEIKERRRKELMEELNGDTDETESVNTPVRIDGPEHFNDTIDKYDVVLVDFYADWCGPCKMMEPVMEEIARESDAVVAKVNVDNQPALAQEFGVRSIPTMVVFSKGEQVERMMGAQDKGRLTSVVEQYA
ncbi:MAG: thioredoxin [Halobacteria archaeon]|nr:thioredoxin [Halobacteria archaeon]